MVGHDYEPSTPSPHTPEVSTRGGDFDELTGLPNRGYLMNDLELGRINYPGNFALIFIDLDELKKTNDTEGHAAGNELLIKTGETLRETFGVMGTYRLHGDEFAGLLTDEALDEERLEGVIRQTRFGLTARGIKASMGGHIHQPGQTAETVLAAADSNMYKDKLARKERAIQSLPRTKRAAHRLSELLAKYARS